MTDYFYQARVREDPPEDEGEAPFADTARRNPYPPEDEAYWAEGGAAPSEDEQPLWYEDRVRVTGGPPSEAPPPEPPPAQPVGRRGWRAFRRETPRPEVVASPGAAAGEDNDPYWAEQRESEPAAELSPPEPDPRRGWSLFHAKRAEPEVPPAVSTTSAEEEARSSWSEQPGPGTAAEPAPPEPRRRRGWSLFRAKRTEPEVAAAVSAVEAEADEGASRYWAAGGSPREDDESLWYEDRAPLGDDAPPPALPAPQLRSTMRHDSRGEPSEPESPDGSMPEAGAGSYWTERAAEPDIAAEPWQDDFVGAAEDAAAGWEVEQADDENGIVPGVRAYVPGAAAAAARAAAEAGERNIRFDPTKERGPAYYDHAARHSRRVRMLRVALPTIAVLSILGFFAVMSFDSDDDGLPALNLSGINFEQREITMDKPHISGFDGTKRAYEVHAAKATQELGNTKVVTLETITAKFALGDKGRANLAALSGVYDGNTQKLRLLGGIELTTSDGYKAELKEADIDVDAGTVASDTGVVITGKEGSISADSIEVLERGKHVFFRGNVKVSYQPPETPDKEEAGGTAEAAAPGPAPATIEAAPDGST